MKARPRRVENRVAEELTKWSADRGDHWVFERRPAMGRTGPDIEYPNPYRMAIDVKSRKAVSDKFWEFTDEVRDKKVWVHDEDDGGWYICRLNYLESLFDHDWNEEQWNSVVVDRWLDHMRDWALRNSGIGMLVLHKPRKPIGSSVAVIRVEDWLPIMEAMHLI